MLLLKINSKSANSATLKSAKMQDLFSPSVITRDFVASYACTQFMLLSTGLVDTESSTMKSYAQAQKSRDTCLKLFLRL